MSICLSQILVLFLSKETGRTASFVLYWLILTPKWYQLPGPYQGHELSVKAGYQDKCGVQFYGF